MPPDAKTHSPCPRCGGQVALAPQDAAERVSCPGCGARLRLRPAQTVPVPQPAAEVSAHRPSDEPLVNPFHRQVRLCWVLALLSVGLALAFAPFELISRRPPRGPEIG